MTPTPVTRRLPSIAAGSLAALATVSVITLCLGRGPWVSKLLASIITTCADFGVSLPHSEVRMHLLGFFGLGLIYGLIVRREPSSAWRALIALWILAATLELLQSLVPTRSVTGEDLLANLVGVTSGLGLARLVVTAIATLSPIRERPPAIQQ